MYALMVWFCAFCDSGFNDNFNGLMRNDPALGIGSFGQVSRLCLKHAYIIGADEEKAHYKVLRTLIRQKIVPLLHHQQCIEAYIRMAGLVSQTGVGGARATWCGILQSTTIMCPINEKILEFVNREADSDDSDEEGKARATTKKVRRVKGQHFLQLFSEYADEFLNKCNVAIESLWSERMKTIETNIGACRKTLKAANKTGIVMYLPLLGGKSSFNILPKPTWKRGAKLSCVCVLS
jgi:hypothetical protein